MNIPKHMASKISAKFEVDPTKASFWRAKTISCYSTIANRSKILGSQYHLVLKAATTQMAHLSDRPASQPRDLTIVGLLFEIA